MLLFTRTTLSRKLKLYKNTNEICVNDLRNTYKPLVNLINVNLKLNIFKLIPTEQKIKIKLQITMHRTYLKSLDGKILDLTQLFIS